MRVFAWTSVAVTWILCIGLAWTTPRGAIPGVVAFGVAMLILAAAEIDGVLDEID